MLTRKFSYKYQTGVEVIRVNLLASGQRVAVARITNNANNVEWAEAGGTNGETGGCTVFIKVTSGKTYILQVYAQFMTPGQGYARGEISYSSVINTTTPNIVDL